MWRERASDPRDLRVHPHLDRGRSRGYRVHLGHLVVLRFGLGWLSANKISTTRRGAGRRMRTSLCFPCRSVSGCKELTPLGQSSGSVRLEIVPAVEGALRVKVVVDGGMESGEFLQRSHPAKAKHSAFPSSEWQIWILCRVVWPAICFPVIGQAASHSTSAVRPKFINHHDFRATAGFH